MKGFEHLRQTILAFIASRIVCEISTYASILCLPTRPHGCGVGCGACDFENAWGCGAKKCEWVRDLVGQSGAVGPKTSGVGKRAGRKTRGALWGSVAEKSWGFLRRKRTVFSYKPWGI